MKGKKLISVLLSAAMTAGILAGCGSASGSTASTAAASAAPAASAAATSAASSAASSSAAAQTAASSDNGEDYNIKMQIVTWGQNPDELADVESAINAIVQPEIGVTVTLEPIAAWDLINESNMELTAGDKIDLLCIFSYGQAMDSIANYTSKNMLRSLNDLYAQYGTDIGPVLGEEINDGYVGDTLYAIPAKATLGAGYGFSARKDYLDEMGITPDPDKIYTMDELTDIFQKYKDKYGDGHYALSLYGAGTDVYSTFNPLETLGGTGNNGVLLDSGLDGNTKVVDLFETDEYMNYCKQIHSWFGAGFINPDVNTISDDVTSQMKSGNYLGMVGTVYPGSLVGIENNVGVEFETFNTVAPYASTTASSMALWAIPTTCENPEKTMQFLNILYQDRDLSKDVDSLLASGLEGKSYDVTQAVSGSKAIVKAGTGTWSKWVPDTLYGNYYTTPKYEPNTADIYDQLAAFDKGITDANRIPKTFGYVFDPAAVSTQAAAVTSVTSQYRGLVGYGAADPEEVLPEFISALKDAGIDDIIAENQKQLDAWLAKK
ncbi:MAG: ABC transporter substrate-binding protein [Lachnospiraceae bacterium]|nr:ABC transporter substrate-binding protein [Lachnospiraceae bacterium]